MPSVSQAQQHYFGAIKGGAIPRPKGMSAKTVDDFAATKRNGLPEHLANGKKPGFNTSSNIPTGRSPVTNTAFQQNERSFGQPPSWMEKKEKTPMLADGKKCMADGRPEWMGLAAKHAAGAPAPNKSGGGHWMASVEAATPSYRVRKTVVGTGKLALADGKTGDWADKAFVPSHRGDLHRALGVPIGEKIPVEKMSSAMKSKSSHVRHMAQAARNI
jgi:hypothetical protein